MGIEDAWDNRLGTSVAYHLDNRRFVAWLKALAAEAGVERIEATVAEVQVSEDGREVAGLVLGDGRRLAFDLYVDASGFRSLLLERALGCPWVSFAPSLWTDGAVVANVPHGGIVRPYTTAETMKCGWCWSTPQEDADHRGYVFASAFQTPDEAEAEMRRAYPGMGEARLVRFRAGRHERFWQGNVVALGNAYGFVEPLESTALHMLVRQIGLLVSAFPLRRGERGLPEQLNRKVAGWWDYLRWFLALHYRWNRRLDSPFWRACRERVDVSLHEELIAAFRERGPLSTDPAARSGFDYPDPLWGPEGIDLLLLGQGERPRRLPRPALGPRAWEERLHRAREVAGRAAPHETALAALRERPELLAGFVAAFRAAGPAFGVSGETRSSVRLT
jgi:tryptophan 7-halogenase